MVSLFCFCRDRFQMVTLEKLNPSHSYGAGPTGELKLFCSCTKVHWTFSKGTHDRSQGHGRPWFFQRHHLANIHKDHIY